MDADGMDADGTGDGGARVDEGQNDSSGGEERRKWGPAKQHVKTKKMTFAKVKYTRECCRYRQALKNEAEII